MSVALLGLALGASPGGFPNAEHAFVSHGSIPTWTGVASDWQGSREVHVYDHARYRGHADFVSEGLKTGLSFRQFKARVQKSDREYLPFFLYDLRGQGVVVGGSPRAWALRLEDYQYLDPDSGLCADTAVLYARVAAHTGFSPEDGLVVLATSDSVRPNTACAATLAGKGIAHATLSAIRTGAPAVEVLNPGTAYGTLRFVDPGRPFAPGPRDIPVYAALPERVPPVAAVLTLVPQTPLSHVNLLCRNRGTPNVFVASPALVGATDGTPVRLEARMGTGPAGFTVTPVSAEEVAAWWDARPERRITVPAVDPAGGLVDLATRPTVTRVGAKAANYGLLQELLPTTRPGWALGFGVYAQHAERAGVPARVDALLADLPHLTPDDVDGRLAAIRRAIRDTSVDPAVLADLRKLFVAHPGWKRVRLRSSTNSEDLPEFNGAGLYESTGFDVEDDDAKLADKLRKVLASLWSDRAFAERSWAGIDHRAVGLAVLVHEAFSEELANGVIVTIASPDGVELVVNANPGDAAVTNPEPGVLPERFHLPLAGGAPVVDAKGSLGPVFLGGPSQALLGDLTTWTRTVHEALVGTQPSGSRLGVDIEFKVMASPSGPVLIFKQARLLVPPSPG